MTKTDARDENNAMIEAFLAKGGKVTVVEPARKTRATQLNKHMGKA
jgi:hypothetical protein